MPVHLARVALCGVSCGASGLLLAAGQQPDDRRGFWLARLVVVLFLVAVYAYYELCKAVGMFIAWSFLIGFPPAFPLTFLAVRADRNGQPLWIVAAWTLLAFGVFFWSAQALLLWKAAA